MAKPLTESTVEEATLDWLEEWGYSVLHGSTIAPGERDAERTSTLRRKSFRRER